MAVTMSFYVEAPAESVFDYFKDPNNQVDVSPFSAMEVHDVRTTKEGAGTFYEWSVKMLGIPLKGFEVMTDVQPNKHITEQSSNPMVGRWDYSFEPQGSGTKVTLEHRGRSLWDLPPLRNVMDLAVPRMSRGFMAAVKKELEAKPAVPSQRKPAAGRQRKPAASK